MTKSIIVVTICYKLLCHSSRFLISNFLASTDIKVFGRTYLFAMLLLIGLALFLHPGCFCLVVFNSGRITNYVTCVSDCFGDIKAEGASRSTPSFIIFSPFYRRKRKIVQWMNLQWNSSFVNWTPFPLLCEKSGAILYS